MPPTIPNEAAMRVAAELTGNQVDILRHTSRTGRYVSDEEPDLADLAARGLLRDHGAQPLAGGMHYYTPTPAGRAALNTHLLTRHAPATSRTGRNEGKL